MQKPTLYLMLGYPGAGKTTVAEYIAELTGAVHINSDQFRLHMFKSPLNISETEHDYMYKMLDYIAEEVLTSGKSVIYDANLNRFVHRQEKYDICKKTNAKPLIVWVKTDAQTAKQRATIEAKNHPEHRPFGNMDKSVFDRLINQIETPKKTENYIEIDGTQPSKDKVARAIK